MALRLYGSTALRLYGSTESARAVWYISACNNHHHAITTMQKPLVWHVHVLRWTARE